MIGKRGKFWGGFEKQSAFRAVQEWEITLMENSCLNYSQGFHTTLIRRWTVVCIYTVPCVCGTLQA